MNKIIKNSNGVALLMVLTAITILTAVLADFTFDGKINKIKVINAEEKAQAKLNAEAGIALSVARLRLYKDIFNILQKNKDAKDFVTQQVLNQVWEFPFMFPLPIDKKMLANQKAAIEKFQKESFLTGRSLINIFLIKSSSDFSTVMNGPENFFSNSTSLFICSPLNLTY